MSAANGRAKQNLRAFSRAASSWRAAMQFGDIKRYLTAGGYKIVTSLDWFESCSRRDRPRQAPLVQCGQAELGAACGIGREWVNRIVRHCLEPLGLVKVTRRANRRRDGRFQTHLYELTARARRLLSIPATVAPARADQSRVMYRSHGIVGTTSFSTPAAESLGNSPPETT